MAIEGCLKGWSAYSHGGGWCCLTVFETFMIMFGFASLVIAILTFNQKK
ncbi:putative holin-like toxin [Neobacillus niacini]